MMQLVMEPAERAFRGARVVVLNKRIQDAEGLELRPVVSLKEETARVAKDGGTQFANTRKGSFNPLKAIHAQPK